MVIVDKNRETECCGYNFLILFFGKQFIVRRCGKELSNKIVFLILFLGMLLYKRPSVAWIIENSVLG